LNNIGVRVGGKPDRSEKDVGEMSGWGEHQTGAKRMRGQTENLIDIFEMLVFITTESMSLFIVLRVSSLYLLVSFKLSTDAF